MGDQGFNAQAMNAARNTYRRFVSLPQPPNLFQVPDTAGTVSSKFPVKLGSTDPEDDKFGLRAQLVNQNDGQVPGVGLAVAGDDYFNYAQRKREEAMMYEFYQYIMSQADLSKPESAAWWFEHFPWMKDWRLEEIDRQAEVQKKLAKIQITGPQTEEDWMVLYLKQQGILGEQAKPLYQLDTGTYAENFKAGMYSIFSNPKNTVLVPQQPPRTGPAPGSMPSRNLAGSDTYQVNWQNPIGAQINNGRNIPGLGGDGATSIRNILSNFGNGIAAGPANR